MSDERPYAVKEISSFVRNRPETKWSMVGSLVSLCTHLVGSGEWVKRHTFASDFVFFVDLLVFYNKMLVADIKSLSSVSNNDTGLVGHVL